MSNTLAHRKDTGSCVCGSAWNYSEAGCSSLYPFSGEYVSVFALANADDDWNVGDDGSYFECRKGHAFCMRHPYGGE